MRDKYFDNDDFDEIDTDYQPVTPYRKPEIASKNTGVYKLSKFDFADMLKRDLDSLKLEGTPIEFGVSLVGTFHADHHLILRNKGWDIWTSGSKTIISFSWRYHNQAFPEEYPAKGNMPPYNR